MASIANGCGAQVAAPSRRRGARRNRFRENNLLERNQEWLRTKRFLGKTYREMADFLNLPLATVQGGIEAAIVAEEAEQAESLAAERAAAGLEQPEAIPGTGLTHDDLVYLQETYPAGTEAGDDPAYRQWCAHHGIARLTRAELERRRQGHRALLPASEVA